MCRRIVCATCNKFTWTGCGNHVAQAMAGVKEEDRCRCKENKTSNVSSNSATKCDPNTGVCYGPVGHNSGRK